MLQRTIRYAICERRDPEIGRSLMIGVVDQIRQAMEK